jgi:hypothetical protein
MRMHYLDAKSGLDRWDALYVLAPFGPDGPDWDRAETSEPDSLSFDDEPPAEARFAALPSNALGARWLKQYPKSLADHAYRTRQFELLRCPALKLTAIPGASESEFRAQVSQRLRERRDEAVDALRRKYASRLGTLEDRKRRAEQKLVREQAQVSDQTMSSALSVGGSLLGALFGGGRRAGMLSKAATAARGVGRISKERTDVVQAEADVEAVRGQHQALEAELAREIEALDASSDATGIEIEAVAVKPRKGDIEVSDVALVWQPA